MACLSKHRYKFTVTLLLSSLANSTEIAEGMFPQNTLIYTVTYLNITYFNNYSVWLKLEFMFNSRYVWNFFA
jgi:hypothetical protein